MKSKSLNFIIPLVVYPFDVMVSIDETDEELSKRLKGFSYDQDGVELLMNLPPTTQGRCVMLSSNQTVIRLKKQLTKHQNIANVSHEIFHAVTFILNRIGMKMEVEVSDEAYAYLIAYLTSEIYKKL